MQMWIGLLAVMLVLPGCVSTSPPTSAPTSTINVPPSPRDLSYECPTGGAVQHDGETCQLRIGDDAGSWTPRSVLAVPGQNGTFVVLGNQEPTSPEVRMDPPRLVMQDGFLLVSTNAGLDWTRHDFPFIPTDEPLGTGLPRVRTVPIGMTFDSEGTLHITGYTTTSWEQDETAYGVNQFVAPNAHVRQFHLATADLAATWLPSSIVRATSGLYAHSIHALGTKLLVTGFDAGIDPLGSGEVYGFRSDDGGATWLDAQRPFECWTARTGVAVDGILVLPCGNPDGVLKVWRWDGLAFQEEATLEAPFSFSGGMELPMVALPDGRIVLAGGYGSTRLWIRATDGAWSDGVEMPRECAACPADVGDLTTTGLAVDGAGGLVWTGSYDVAQESSVAGGFKEVSLHVVLRWELVTTSQVAKVFVSGEDPASATDLALDLARGEVQPSHAVAISGDVGVYVTWDRLNQGMLVGRFTLS